MLVCRRFAPAAVREERGPCDLRVRDEQGGFEALVHRHGFGEVCVRFVVAAQEVVEPAEVVRDRRVEGDARRHNLVVERRDPFPHDLRRFVVPDADGRVGPGGLRRRPDVVGSHRQPGRDLGVEEYPRLFNVARAHAYASARAG